MKRLTLILLLLLTLALPAFAQDGGDDIETETWTSDDETITLDYPAEWWVWQAEEGNADVLITNTQRLAVYGQELSADSDEDFTVQPGEYALVLSFIPQDLLHESLGLDETLNADDLLELLEVLYEDPDTTLVDSDVIDLTDDLEVAAVFLTDEYGLSTLVMMYPLDDLYIMALAVAHEDDLIDFADHTELIVSSLTVSPNDEFIERASTLDGTSLVDMMARGSSSQAAN